MSFVPVRVSLEMDAMATPSDSELRQRYEQMETYDLLRIVAARPEDYMPRAVEIAREVVARRSTKTDPEILFDLAEERAKEWEGVLPQQDRQSGFSWLVAFLPMLVIVGLTIVGAAIEQYFMTEDAFDPDYLWIPILVGLGILTLSCVLIVRVERRQADRQDRGPSVG